MLRHNLGVARPSLARQSALAISALLLGIAGFVGCSTNPKGTVDPKGSAPSVSAFTAVPASVRLDTLTASNGVYPVAITVSATVQDPDGASDIASVTVEALNPSGTAIASVSLHDDGVSPDVAASDGIYTGTLSLSLSRSDVGTYTLVYSAVDQEQLVGTSAIRSVSITRHSSPPWLYSVHGPDTVTLPSGGSVAFTLSVAVGDSDGLSDLASVVLYVPEGSNPTKAYSLLDNGNTANGDTVQGDGRYSIMLSVNDASNVRKTYHMTFKATDNAGDTSASLIFPLVIQ